MNNYNYGFFIRAKRGVVVALMTIEEQNRVLDHLIDSRRTIRKFKEDSPPRSMIEQVLNAGMLGPYTQILLTREDFRRFVVIPRESEITARASSMMQRRALALHDEVEERMQHDDLYRKTGTKYLGRLKAMGANPLLGKAPYFIVVADQKVLMDMAHVSLGHCLQNMWLKATALGLGFQLLTLTEMMTEDREFCELIGIPFGEYALDGCLIGYPDVAPAPSKRPPLGEMTRWL